MKYYQGRKPKAGDSKKRYRSKSRSAQKVSRKRAGVAVSVSKLSVRGPLGNKVFGKLNYVEKLVITGGAVGAPTYYQFRTNSLFDPNLTGIGHQPLGFDQISALFERYCVTQCEYRISFQNGNGGQGAMWAVAASDVASTSASISEAIEQGNARTGILAPAVGGASTITISGVIKNWEVAGETYDEYISDDTNSAVMTSNPTDTNVLNLIISDSGTAATGPAVYTLVELTYYAYFYGAQLTAAS